MCKDFIDIRTETDKNKLLLQMVLPHKPLQKILLCAQTVLRSEKQHCFRIIIQHAFHKIPIRIIRIQCLIEIATGEEYHAILR